MKTRRNLKRKFFRDIAKQQGVLNKQGLRYIKTTLWCEGKTQEDFNRMLETKRMENYPTEAKTEEEAAKDIKEGTRLKSTGISETDRNAIGAVLEQHFKNGGLKPIENQI